MLLRLLTAAAGALIVTGGLLLAMDNVTSLFENRPNERFFRITDILPRPDPGRPVRPSARPLPPETSELEPEETDAAIAIESPLLPADGSRLSIQPELEVERLSPNVAENPENQQ